MTESTIGRYQILSELTQGGMGVIFLAHDPFMQRPVIIKVLTYQFAMDEFFREYFQQEAKIIASLEHPYIVPVYDFGWQGSQPYFVMRYMVGGSLADLMKRQEIKLADFAKILERVGEALDAAHARKIIHRDIKPANIMFDIENKAFLGDFGIAKIKREAEDEEEWLVGTPYYMSPEQCLDLELDGRSDVYALGVVLFQVLTGSVPFTGNNHQEILNKHKNAPLPNLLDLQPDLPNAWGEIVGKAMAKSPDDRYSSASELAQDVKDLVSGRFFWRKI